MGVTGATGPTGSGTSVPVIPHTESHNFGRAAPGLLVAVTSLCPAGLQAVSGGIDTSVVNGNENDLMRIELLSTHATPNGAGWQGTSIVASRLSQSAELIYAVTAYCIP